MLPPSVFKKKKKGYNILTDLTELSRPSGSTLACELVDTINACCTILTLVVVKTLVDIYIL